MGQQNTETAMPLEDYLDETMMLLASQPNAEEILVEGVTGRGGELVTFLSRSSGWLA
jgi:hypothetical protein